MERQTFNYGINRIDRCNQITNTAGYSRADLVFPGNLDKENLHKAILGFNAMGLCYSVDLCSSDDEDDIRFRVFFHHNSKEQYKRFMQELFFRDLIPVGVAYIPSKEEVGL